MKENEKITLSFDGQMFITDGKQIEEFSCYKETDVNRFVMVYHPAKMHHIPENSLVLDKPEDEKNSRR